MHASTAAAAAQASRGAVAERRRQGDGKTRDKEMWKVRDFHSLLVFSAYSVPPDPPSLTANLPHPQRAGGYDEPIAIQAGTYQTKSTRPCARCGQTPRDGRGTHAETSGHRPRSPPMHHEAIIAMAANASARPMTPVSTATCK